MKTVRSLYAFTLVELLVVISILGILAALTVPALKNLGKSNVQTSATRQLLDDIGRARQLAISGHTTVYMVFVNTNFWISPDGGSGWLNTLTAPELTVVTNLMDKQMSGYSFIAYGALGDQPGRHQWHYLEPWQSLPQGYIIAPWKFTFSSSPQAFRFSDPINANSYAIYPFDFANNIPFPLADSNLVQQAANGATPYVPYLAFNYLGQLVSTAGDQDFAGGGADIPLAQGSVTYPLDPATKIPRIPSSPLGPTAVTESPTNNSIGTTYNVVHIDALTGRATLEFHQVQ